MLTFIVLETSDATEWCHNLSTMLKEKNLPATIFILGKVAEQNPLYASFFSSKVDFGSQTYNKIDLASINDYSVKLQEVKEGKAAVDKAGNFDVKIFRASNGIPDYDIFSLLSRNGILADFSYLDHFNVYENDQFVRYEAQVYEWKNYSPDFFLNKAKTTQPIIINFDSNHAVSRIGYFLSELQKGDFEFVNASQLTGLTLTSRGT